MDQKRFQELFAETVAKLENLLVVKGGEYAGSEDRLANFKRNAERQGVNPLAILDIYMSKHWDSWTTYVRNVIAGKEQKLSEPIEGRLHDIINYCILATALIEEQAAADKVAEKAYPVIDYGDAADRLPESKPQEWEVIDIQGYQSVVTVYGKSGAPHYNKEMQRIVFRRRINETLWEKV